MKSAFFFCVFTIVSSISFSQTNRRQNVSHLSHIEVFRRNVIISLQPFWETNSASVLKKQFAASDSVYVYAKKKKNTDSALYIVQEFDSNGNVIERDEYSFRTGHLWRITNFSYNIDLLFKKEEVTKRIFAGVDSSKPQKNITTYEYDSAGNLSGEKLYYNFNDSTGKASVTELKREYTPGGKVLTESVKLPHGEFYLHYKYIYNDFGKLLEVRTFNQSRLWQYSILHEYDEAEKEESISVVNPAGERTIQKEIYYDDKSRYVQIKDYENTGNRPNAVVQAFSYSAIGLTDKQEYEDEFGIDYYLKHFYTFYK